MTIIFFTLRLLSFIPGLILTISQARILIKKWGNHNGMKNYRLLLFLLTLSFTINSGIIAYADFLMVFFGIGHSASLTGLTQIRLFIRLLELISIWYFYKIIYNAKHDGPDHKKIK